HGWPPTRTLAVDRSPPIPGGARRRPRFGCMKHEPGGRFHVAATEDLITEQRQTERIYLCDRRDPQAARHLVALSDECRRQRNAVPPSRVLGLRLGLPGEPDARATVGRG